jgi:ABC-type Fe3+ transport system permease subunit
MQNKWWCFASFVSLLGAILFTNSYYRGIRLGNEAATQPPAVGMGLFESAYASAWFAIAFVVATLIFAYLCRRSKQRSKKAPLGALNRDGQ